MEKSPRTQHLLNWLDREKTKDNVEVEINKKKLIQEIRKFKKEELIKTTPKLSLWEKLKIMIWGR